MWSLQPVQVPAEARCKEHAVVVGWPGLRLRAKLNKQSRTGGFQIGSVSPPFLNTTQRPRMIHGASLALLEHHTAQREARANEALPFQPSAKPANQSAPPLSALTFAGRPLGLRTPNGRTRFQWRSLERRLVASQPSLSLPPLHERACLASALP